MAKKPRRNVRIYVVKKTPIGILQVVNRETGKVLVENYKKPQYIKLVEKGSKHKAMKNLYRCMCGTEFVSRSYQIKSGKTLSCGCVARLVRAKNVQVNNVPLLILTEEKIGGDERGVLRYKKEEIEVRIKELRGVGKYLMGIDFTVNKRLIEIGEKLNLVYSSLAEGISFSKFENFEIIRTKKRLLELDKEFTIVIEQLEEIGNENVENNVFLRNRKRGLLNRKYRIMSEIKKELEDDTKNI